MKNIGVAQPIWSWCIFACFWAYDRQSLNLSHINALCINPSIWELAVLKISVFLSRQFWILLNKFFASFPWKAVNIYRIARMGRHFDDYPGFQQIPGILILLQQSVTMQFYICNLFYDSFLHGSCHFFICHIFAISDKMSRNHDYLLLLHSTYYKLICRSVLDCWINNWYTIHLLFKDLFNSQNGTC